MNLVPEDSRPDDLPPEPQKTGGKGTQLAKASPEHKPPVAKKRDEGIASTPDRLTTDIEDLVETGTSGQARWMLVIVRSLKEQIQDLRTDLRGAKSEADIWREKFHTSDKERAVLDKADENRSLRAFFVGLGGVLAGFSGPYLISGSERWLAGCGVLVGLAVMYLASKSPKPPKV